MSSNIISRAPYYKRIPPKTYSDGWLSIELGNIQRSMTTTLTRELTSSDSPYTPLSQDITLFCDATNGPIDIVLVPAGQAHGLYFNVMKTDASANVVTIVGTVSGVVDPTLTNQYEGMTIQSSNTAYYKLGEI